jgi:hypothetical protein
VHSQPTIPKSDRLLESSASGERIRRLAHASRRCRRRRRNPPNAQAKGLASARSDAGVSLLERDCPARRRRPSTEGANRSTPRPQPAQAVNLSGKADSRQTPWPLFARPATVHFASGECPCPPPLPPPKPPPCAPHRCTPCTSSSAHAWCLLRATPCPCSIRLDCSPNTNTRAAPWGCSTSRTWASCASWAPMRPQPSRA